MTLQGRRKGCEAWETGRRGKGTRGGWRSDAHTFWLSLILLRRTLICKKRRKERVTLLAPTRLRARLAWGWGGQDQWAEPLSCLAPVLPGPRYFSQDPTLGPWAITVRSKRLRPW